MLPTLLAAAVSASMSPARPLFWAPAGNRYAQVVPGGTTILPNGRLLTPSGERLYTRTDLWHVVVSPDGRTVVGFDEEGLTVIGGVPGARRRQSVPIKNIAPAGAFSSDGRFLVVSLGDAGAIQVLDAGTWKEVPDGRISTGKDSHIVDLVLTRDGRRAYALDVAGQKLLVIDVPGRRVVKTVEAGRQPYAVVLSSDEKRLFVANIGLFDYTVVPKPEPGMGDPRGLTRPPFGFPSKESYDGVQMEGRWVAGLGDPRVPEAHSVWAYDLRQPDSPTPIKKLKTGLLIHAPAGGGKAVGGSSPNSLLCTGGQLLVSNGNNDTLQVFDEKSLRLVRTVSLTPSKLVAGLRGVIPSGLAVSRDGQRVFVCESGLNSVAVLAAKTGKVLGRIATGWFPMKLAVAPDGRTLYIANQKGVGRGPQGSLHPRTREDERFGMPAMPGMIQAVKLPMTIPELSRGCQTVLANNGIVDRSKDNARKPVLDAFDRARRHIKHVVFITKENHTFDGIFGELKSRGARGEPEYAEFGTQGWIAEKGRSERLPIMPNHIKLANEFAISDNFYMEPQASGDGHRWLVGLYPSLWTTRVFYAGWGFKLTNEARGRLASFGSNGSQIPEDYLENGSLWEHLQRGQIDFRNYGEGYEMPGSDEGWMTNRSGVFVGANWPMPKVLFDNTCFDFPCYNNNIPDIARTDWFIEDLEKNFRAKGKPLPSFLNVAICNDHGAAPNEKQGYPYVASYMADNDLALGRMVEWLSHQPEWKNMAIFVTQDDSGADNDHIDRHRSFVLCISPYAKRSHISREHGSIMSIIKTIYMLFGLGPNNMFDALATDLADLFTDKPNFQPYKHVMTDSRVFKPEATFDPTDPKFERRRKEAPQVAMDDPAFVEWLRLRGAKERETKGEGR